MINYIGLFAATVSTFIAYFTMTLYRMHDIKKKYFKISTDKKFVIQTIISLIIIIPIYYWNNIKLNVLGILIAVVYAWIVNKNSINIVWNFIKEKLKIHKEVEI